VPNSVASLPSKETDRPSWGNNIESC